MSNAVVIADHWNIPPQDSESTVGLLNKSDTDAKTKAPAYGVSTPIKYARVVQASKAKARDAKSGERQPALSAPLADTRPRQNLQPLQEWEGYVVHIGEDIFSARLIDITAGGQIEEEIVDLPIDDLSDASKVLLTEGAIFRWVIGYQRALSGTKMRVSNIVFRRLPAWTKSDLSSARAKSIALRDSINWD